MVDDLLALTIIAVFFTDELKLAWLALALVPIGAFGLLAQRRVASWSPMVPLALAA